jgi:hypothetical protein
LEDGSERVLIRSLKKGDAYGVEIGKDEGYKTLDLFIETVARDTYWAYLPQFRLLVNAETKGAPSQSPIAQAKAAESVLEVIKPLAYTEEEIKVLRNGYLEAGPRVAITNEMRACWLNLSNAKALPPQQVISEEPAVKLFKDPSLFGAEVESILAGRALALAIKAINAQRPGPAPGRPEPPTQHLGPAGEAKAARLRAGLAERVKQDPHLQTLLLEQAEKAVEPAWESYACPDGGRGLALHQQVPEYARGLTPTRTSTSHSPGAART